MNIALLSGGTSDERDVSLRSGASVTAALRAAGHIVDTFDPKTHPIDATLCRYDVVFPVLHGVGGEDGRLQRVLDSLDVPYVGSDADASTLCFDKHAWRNRMKEHGVTVAEGTLVSEAEFASHPLARHPFVLKPYDGGSTIDTLIVRDVTSVSTAAIHDVFSRHHTLLLEQLINGIEITVATIGGKALPVIEIIPPAAGEFDYENKYNGLSQELCPPENIDTALQQEAMRLAEVIDGLCDCRHITRTDMIVTPDRKIYALETNTLPGMTENSLVPKAASASGIDMPTLCDKLVRMATSSD